MATTVKPMKLGPLASVQFDVAQTRGGRLSSVWSKPGSCYSSGPKTRKKAEVKQKDVVLVESCGSRSGWLAGRYSSWSRIVFASNRVRSIALLNFLTLVYATDIPVLKEVDAIVEPAAFTAVRFAVTAIPFLPFLFCATKDVRVCNQGVELGLWVSLGYLMQALGLLSSDAGRASFLSVFTVVVVPFLDALLGAVVPAHTWFGAFMSVVGIGMLESSGSPPTIGDLLNFLSAVFFGIHTIRTEHISRGTSKKNFLPLLGYEVCVIAVFSAVWYFCGGWLGGHQTPDPSSWTWEMFCHWMVTFPWIPALYTGVFSTGLCLWLEMAAMVNVSATEAAIIYGLEPVWGGAFAWFILGERWGPTGWIGAALVLGGSLMVQLHGSLSPNKREEDQMQNVKDGLRVLDKHNALSTSPITVNSRINRTHK